MNFSDIFTGSQCHWIVTEVLAVIAAMWTQGPTSIILDRKMAQRCGVWQNDGMTSLNQGQVLVKSDSSGFWTFWTLKFTDFETRFWTRDTCTHGF